MHACHRAAPSDLMAQKTRSPLLTNDTYHHPIIFMHKTWHVHCFTLINKNILPIITDSVVTMYHQIFRTVLEEVSRDWLGEFQIKLVNSLPEFVNGVLYPCVRLQCLAGMKVQSMVPWDQKQQFDWPVERQIVTSQSLCLVLARWCLHYWSPFVQTPSVDCLDCWWKPYAHC